MVTIEHKKDKPKLVSEQPKRKYNYTKKTGRPTKYRPIYAKKIVTYFDKQPYQMINGKMYTNTIPTLMKFAKSIKVGIETVYNWVNENHSSYHSEFSRGFKRAKELRGQMLNDAAAMGLIPSNTYKFLAVNMTEMRDKKEVEHSGELTLGSALAELARKERANSALVKDRGLN